MVTLRPVRVSRAGHQSPRATSWETEPAPRGRWLSHPEGSLASVSLSVRWEY